ncbi:hypothetical protein J057_12441 [Marinobacter nanhaiticus D15-8W]|uniref:Uncharacterized protein n=1 Tax=Marinobacter nanhaiticus D15-8W TaxID=626887 RepID=N6X525_9GAMM|nr:hypothetical protein J057_12441 [Marinobacter nanhaiticus D15-8W]
MGLPLIDASSFLCASTFFLAPTTFFLRQKRAPRYLVARYVNSFCITLLNPGTNREAEYNGIGIYFQV